MSEDRREEALSALEQQLGDRLERGPIRGEVPGAEDALASVIPMSAEDLAIGDPGGIGRRS